MKELKARYFFAAAVVAIGASVYFMWSNQQEASRLVQTVLNKDQAGGDITAEVDDLRTYATTHTAVNTTVFLKGSFERSQAEAQAAANPASNGEAYAAAQASCAGQSDSVSQSNCVQSYLNTHTSPSSNPQAVEMPKQEDFTKTFASNGWTTDVAGIALLIASGSAAMGVYLYLVRRFT